MSMRSLYDAIYDVLKELEIYEEEEKLDALASRLEDT